MKKNDHKEGEDMSAEEQPPLNLKLKGVNEGLISFTTDDPSVSLAYVEVGVMLKSLHNVGHLKAFLASMAEGYCDRNEHIADMLKGRSITCKEWCKITNTPYDEELQRIDQELKW